MRVIPVLLGLLCLFAAAASAEPELEWAAVYDGGGTYTDEAQFSLISPAGDLYVAGRSESGHSGLALFVCKIDRQTGDFLWTRRQAADDLSEMTVSGMAFDAAGDLVLSSTIVGCVG